MADIFRQLSNTTALTGAPAADDVRGALAAPKTDTPTSGTIDDEAAGWKKGTAAGDSIGDGSPVTVRYISTHAAAQLLDLKPQTLAKWRWSGRGPPYTKLNGAVRYALADVLTFAAAGRRRSTSDPGPRLPIADL